MNLGEALKTINFTKQNLVRDENGNLTDESVPIFIASRTLSYSPDCVMYLALLNQYSSFAQFNMTPQMQYEFLLGVIPKSKRFNKWKKSKSEEVIDFIMTHYNVSYSVAKGYYRLLNTQHINNLMSSTGGKI